MKYYISGKRIWILLVPFCPNIHIQDEASGNGLYSARVNRNSHLWKTNVANVSCKGSYTILQIMMYKLWECGTILCTQMMAFYGEMIVMGCSEALLQAIPHVALSVSYIGLILWAWNSLYSELQVHKTVKRMKRIPKAIACFPPKTTEDPRESSMQQWRNWIVQLQRSWLPWTTSCLQSGS